jgi:predicted HicB family RNase H-like nuclease
MNSPMSVRIQVVIAEREREAFPAQAAAEGKSLSQWLRDAGRERLAR